MAASSAASVPESLTCRHCVCVCARVYMCACARLQWCVCVLMCARVCASSHIHAQRIRYIAPCALEQQAYTRQAEAR